MRDRLQLGQTAQAFLMFDEEAGDWKSPCILAIPGEFLQQLIKSNLSPYRAAVYRTLKISRMELFSCSATNLEIWTRQDIQKYFDTEQAVGGRPPRYAFAPANWQYLLRIYSPGGTYSDMLAI